MTNALLNRLRNGDTQARKAWIESLITRIEVDDDRIRVIGETPVLAAAVTDQNPPSPGVRGFVRNWCTRQRCKNPIKSKIC